VAESHTATRGSSARRTALGGSGAPDLCTPARTYYIQEVNRYVLEATATFGLESAVSAELAGLGFDGLKTRNGGVVFEGTEEDIARCNIWLRAADRVLVRLAEFPAEDADDVYEGVRAIRWADFLGRNPRVVVTARSVRSRLSFVPALQSVGKKAIVDAIRGSRERIEETGPLYPVHVAVSADKASVTLDTSGSGLHKRGYRTEAGEAPLRETLAAGMVLLSRWNPSRPFLDPLCGSGTIAIEAALIAMNAAPGASRAFAAELWPHIPAEVWRRAREQAASSIRPEQGAEISASDRDSRLILAAGRNATRAGVASRVAFRLAPAESVKPRGEYGCIVTNPPYAHRLGENREVENLYRVLGRLYRSIPTWSFFALSAHPAFPKLFGGRPSRNRKLYNGNMRCYFYQYFGPLPPDGGRPSAVQ
jgi:putative N6-adenine-specific DNA methylase